MCKRLDHPGSGVAASACRRAMLQTALTRQRPGRSETAVAEHPAAGFVSCPERATRARRGLAASVPSVRLRWGPCRGSRLPDCGPRKNRGSACVKGRARPRSVSVSQCRAVERDAAVRTAYGRREQARRGGLNGRPSCVLPRCKGGACRFWARSVRRSGRKAAPGPRNPRQQHPAPPLPPHLGRTALRAATL